MTRRETSKVGHDDVANFNDVRDDDACGHPCGVRLGRGGGGLEVEGGVVVVFLGEDQPCFGWMT